MDTLLTAVEARVLACLVEKESTTPEYYPLTLNALVAACNQKTNRDPVMQVDEKDVVRALDGLRARKVAWEGTSTGSRVPKYRHGVRELIALSPPQLAVLCELMLRSPQTVAELRVRAARMAELADTSQVIAVLQELMAWQGGPLAARLPRVTGQREERYAHLLCGPLAQPEEAAPRPEEARLAVIAEDERFARLESGMAALRDEVEKLKSQLAEFRSQFL